MTGRRFWILERCGRETWIVTNNPNNILTRMIRESQYMSTDFEISDEAAMLAKCQDGKQTTYKSRIVLTVRTLAMKSFSIL